jgi:DNA-binding response OmpR family regulator
MLVRLILVEDDSLVAELVTRVARDEGYRVEHVVRCDAAREILLDEQNAHELAIIDVGLPDGSGLDLCREARAARLDVPILLLTASNSVRDRVAGLDAGADDYLGKPFASAELSARIRALGRRRPHWEQDVRVYDGLVLDLDRRTCSRGGDEVTLTPREFELVAYLARSEGRIVERDALLRHVWGDADENTAHSLEVTIARVRRKLDMSPETSCIRTVRQVGYAWALERR